MFRTTNNDHQLDIFSSITGMLRGKAYDQFNDEKSWHNLYKQQITYRINENIFKCLFNDTKGAPNSSIRILISMMVLKEAFGWSDSQLFEQSRFNILVRSSLGLENINDELPVESTYYLLRKRIYEYEKQTGEDLFDKMFKAITHEQVKEFNVNGSIIRMDSKLIGSNIANYSRYEIIHHSFCRFMETLNRSAGQKFSPKAYAQIKGLLKEEPQKTVYTGTKEEIKAKMHNLGLLIYEAVNKFSDSESDEYTLLSRVFKEQYKVIDKQVELRPKEEVTSDSVQSPHDPECSYRNKGDQKVKGYSANITETASQGNVNLITDVRVEKANTPDTKFVGPAIGSTKEVTKQNISKLHTDGAYQSPNNDKYSEDIDFVYTGIQGIAQKYDIEETELGIFVTDKRTGNQYQAQLAKKLKNSKEDRWRIKTPNGNVYFDQQAIRAAKLRNELKNRSIEDLNRRNNVEATIFQLGYHLRNSKTKYRGILKQRSWAYCRCLWINFVRVKKTIRNFAQNLLKYYYGFSIILFIRGEMNRKIYNYSYF